MVTPDQARLNQIKLSLQKNDLDALILLHPENILMATGMFPGSSHVVTIVDVDGKVTVLTPWWREQFVLTESWADEVTCFDWCKPRSQIDPDKAVTDWLKNWQTGSGIEKIGADLTVHHYSPNKMPSECFTYEKIKKALGTVFPVARDASHQINSLKAIKTSKEIEKLRISHEVIRVGVEVFYQEARVGIREIDLAAEINAAVIRMVGHKGSKYVFCEAPQITSGSDRTYVADTLSNHPTPRKIQAGDLVLLELGVHVDGYWADITRAVVVGIPNDIQVKLHQAVLAAQAAAIEAYYPGKSTGETLCQAAWTAMREAGFEKGITHFLGHGLGFAYHEDGPTLGPEENVVICPGHVTSIEPGLYWRAEDQLIGGVRVEENVVWGCRPKEVEILSDFYRGLEKP